MPTIPQLGRHPAFRSGEREACIMIILNFVCFDRAHGDSVLEWQTDK